MYDWFVRVHAAFQRAASELEETLGEPVVKVGRLEDDATRLSFTVAFAKTPKRLTLTCDLAESQITERRTDDRVPFISGVRDWAVKTHDPFVWFDPYGDGRRRIYLADEVARFMLERWLLSEAQMAGGRAGEQDHEDNADDKPETV